MPPYGSYTGIAELPDHSAGVLLAPSSVLVWSYRFHLLKVCFVLHYGPQGLKIGANLIALTSKRVLTFTDKFIDRWDGTTPSCLPFPVPQQISALGSFAEVGHPAEFAGCTKLFCRDLLADFSLI